MNANSPVDKDGMGTEFAIASQLHEPAKNLCEKTTAVFLFQQPELSVGTLGLSLVSCKPRRKPKSYFIFV